MLKVDARAGKASLRAQQAVTVMLAVGRTSLCGQPVSQIHGPMYSVSIFAYYLGLLFVTRLAPRAPC
jgi:hypothetical protein